MKDVYITKLSVFLPNEPVSNDEMEDYLGFINGKKSKSKAIVLRSNKIEQRYYAMDKNGVPTHTNAELVATAIRKMITSDSEMKNVELLACGTATPDQLLPSHAVMVHGLLPESSDMEVISNSGSCCASMQAFRHAYLAIKAGDKNSAICSGSERVSTILRADNFEEEAKKLEEIDKNPYIAFEKDFLRWMLSDGAGVFLLENKKSEKNLSLKVEWVDILSFANSLPTCMYMGAAKDSEGNLVGYQDMPWQKVVDESVMSIKQDVKLLGENIITKGFSSLRDLLIKKKVEVSEIDYFLPHLSSHFFQDKIYKELADNGIEIPYDKWFMNLKTCGNTGSGSIYIMLEDLYSSGKLKIGDKILLAVPESARFSFAFSLLTVC